MIPKLPKIVQAFVYMIHVNVFPIEEKGTVSNW